jgi:hypothetical protein
MATAAQHTIDDVRNGLREARFELGELRFACFDDGELVQRAHPGGTPVVEVRLDLRVEGGRWHQCRSAA